MRPQVLGGLLSLDLPTLLIASGIVLTVCGAIFVLSTIRHHSDYPSRLWSAAFSVGILTMVSFAVWAAIPESPVVIGVGNGALVTCIALIWSGNRAFNERASRSLVAVAGGLLVAVVAWIDVAGGSWAGGQLFLIGVAVFALLAGAEALRGRMRRSRNARILAVVMLVVGSFYTLRAIVFAIGGPESPLFVDYLGTDVTTVITIIFVITASTSLALLRLEDQPGEQRLLDTGRWDRFATRELFATAVDDRLARLEVSAETAVLVRVDIDNLPEMNIAFGRAFTESAMILVGNVIRNTVSAAAVLGHTGGSGFDALVFENVDSALECAKRIRSALIDTPIDVSQGLRISATIALVIPESGERFAGLAYRASQLVLKGQIDGGNVIVGHPEEYSRA